jgi:hypothetical protein
MNKILNLTVIIFFMIFLSYLIIEIVPSDTLGGIDRVRIISERIETIASEAWKFFRPILQLIIILFIIEWIAKRAGFKLDLSNIEINKDVRSLLAIIIVIAFSLAALSGSPSSGALQNVCLVVIGFYFGGLSKRQSDQLDNAIKPSKKKRA